MPRKRRLNPQTVTNRFCQRTSLRGDAPPGTGRPVNAVGVLVGCWLVALFVSVSAQAQTASTYLDVPQTQLAPIGNPMPSAGVGGSAYTSTPAATGSPTYGTGAPVYGTGTPGFGTPAPVAPGSGFDPYAAAPSAGYIQPYDMSPPMGGGMLAAPPPVGASTLPPASPTFGPTYGSPAGGYPSGGTPAPFTDNSGMIIGNPLGGAPQIVPYNGYGGGAWGAPAPVPQGNIYPNQTPTTLFPNGLNGQSTSSYLPQFNPYRLVQRMRFRHTFVHDGDGPTDLETNDTDVALAFAFPRFFWSEQPLFVAPAFSVHLWDGPDSSSGADLPSSAYSFSLDFAWQSDPNQMFGTELAVSVGSFSEWDVFTDDSIRVRGKGLGFFRLTPTTTFKLGVFYLDRVDVKILPAIGVFCRPNPYKRVDLFFPQPKFAHYISTVGTQDVWWYMGGEYGGGSWTIQRDGGGDDQVDINDIRVTLGLEWGESAKMRAGMRTWFAEAGFVFDRELVYRNNPQDNISLGETWMVRLGIGY